MACLRLTYSHKCSKFISFMSIKHISYIIYFDIPPSIRGILGGVGLGLWQLSPGPPFLVDIVFEEMNIDAQGFELIRKPEFYDIF